MTAAPLLELAGVAKSFGSAPVLCDVHLRVPEGEFLAIVGFSGSGKTTLVSLMAGLLEPDAGQVLLAGRPIDGPGPDRGVVFQNYSLLPWLTVYGNVELAVRRVHRSLPARERRELTLRFIELVNLTAARDKRPAQLSGGMRQRVSLARALAMDPRILLLDEPLSALDALTRATLQDEVLRIWEKDRKTVVMITNDVDEAILLADRIIPLRPGPRATLGPCFPVDIARPRDRRAVNHDPAFIRLRNEVTQYLVAEGRRAHAAVRRRAVELPAIAPVKVGSVRRSFWRAGGSA
jgi:nitrate/nitrite transport system ATP-binding protein